jgi:hypothetical protein
MLPDAHIVVVVEYCIDFGDIDDVGAVDAHKIARLQLFLKSSQRKCHQVLGIRGEENQWDLVGFADAEGGFDAIHFTL